MRAAAVVLAGGSGPRIGAAGNKAYLPVAGRPLVSWALRAFAAVPEVRRLVLVIRAADRAAAERTVAAEVGVPVEVILGGVARHDSEHQALAHLAPAIRAGELDVVAIHDGARPVIDPVLIGNVLAAADRHGGAIPGLALPDLAVAGPGGEPAPVPAGRRLVRVQTPQAFRAGPLLAAYQAAARDGFAGTDTAACVECYTGVPVHCLPGDPRNIKVTYPADLLVAERLLDARHGPAVAAQPTGAGPAAGGPPH
jgi:2-C-methyl-D-erythritol 4-phosphate cytidylyltransferase